MRAFGWSRVRGRGRSEGVGGRNHPDSDGFCREYCAQKHAPNASQVPNLSAAFMLRAGSKKPWGIMRPKTSDEINGEHDPWKYPPAPFPGSATGIATRHPNPALPPGITNSRCELAPHQVPQLSTSVVQCPQSHARSSRLWGLSFGSKLTARSSSAILLIDAARVMSLRDWRVCDISCLVMTGPVRGLISLVRSWQIALSSLTSSSVAVSPPQSGGWGERFTTLMDGCVGRPRSPCVAGGHCLVRPGLYRHQFDTYLCP